MRGEKMATQNSKHKAAIPNPALKPLSILVGEWKVVGTHRLLPDTLHGRTTFEWFEGGAFLKMYWEIEKPEIPDAIAIIGSDDATEGYFMLYFDERGVSRKYEMTLTDNVWKYGRDAPGFSQRFTGMFADNDDTISGVWELSEDNLT
jgi:hypothetical protein